MKSWLSEQVFHDGDEYFQAILKEIRSARISILVEAYIFERDALGAEVLAELRAASRRGVKVKVLIDGVGSYRWGWRYLEEVNQTGIRIRVYHPLPWQGFYPRFRKRPRLIRLLLGLGTLNRRNHRKCFIFDFETAFIGGMNISADHSKALSGAQAWRDTGARVSGPEVRLLTQAFRSAWRAKAPRRKRGSPQALIRVNHTFSKRRLYYRDLLRRILHSENRVWLTSPYFVPELSLLRVLRAAARLKRDVRVMVPLKSDVFFMSWIHTAYYFILLRSGVRIFEYRKRFLHAKTVLIDHWATVGSTNLNHRSLVHDLEADVVLTHPESIRSLEEQFLKDQQESVELTLEEWGRISWRRRLLGRFFLLFKYWI